MILQIIGFKTVSDSPTNFGKKKMTFCDFIIYIYFDRDIIPNIVTLRIIGPSYRGVWICIAGFRDLQTPSFEIP